MYQRKVCTERTTTDAGSHLGKQQHGQIAYTRGGLGMVLSKGRLRDLHRTTTETLGFLILALRNMGTKVMQQQ